MKLLYIMLALLASLVGVYLVSNNFRFEGATFSAFLISGLFIVLTGALFAAGIALLISYKRRQHYKGMMTIRQYYDFKN